MPTATLDQQWVDLSPSTPLSGARLTQLVAAVNEALNVPDSALAARLNDPASLARAAILQVAAVKPKGERWANVTDFFAAGRVQGVTDDRPAFEAARLTGRPVYAPAGHYYISKSPAWGDDARFSGDGKNKTVIHLMDSAPDYISVWDNGTTGSVNGYFSDFTIDANCMRQGGTMQPDAGSRSSGFTLRYARFVTVERVSVINPLQHAFDATLGSYDYPYLGDGAAPAGTRSSDIHYIDCDGSNFGDDAFTCHSSDYITYTRCYGFNPRKRDNCNAFEIDGDSRFVTLNANRSFGCYGGIEIKGHGNENAARVITINGHVSTEDVRSYNWRHIDHHSGSNPISLSATDIIASNLVSLFSNNDRGFQDEATPRGMVIAAFHRVSVHGLTIMGRGGYSAGDVAIGIQSRSGHISLSGVNISGWGGGDQDISITSGDNVSMMGINIEASAKRALYVGSSITAVQVFGMNATAPATGAVNGIELYSYVSENGFQPAGINLMGYPVAIRSAQTNYATFALWARRTTDIAAAAVTRLIDLDPTKDFYASTAEWAALTDIPAGSTGGYFISHSRATTDSVVQTATRNTSGSTLQVVYWRVINYSAKSAGPWVKPTFTVL